MTQRRPSNVEPKKLEESELQGIIDKKIQLMKTSNWTHPKKILESELLDDTGKSALEEWEHGSALQAIVMILKK